MKFFAKILFPVLFLVGLIASSLSVAFAATEKLSLQAETTQNVGNVFAVDVYLETNNNKTCAVEADLTFPKNLLEVQTIIPGDIYNVEALRNFSNITGKINYIAGRQGCTNQSAIIYTVFFKAKESGQAEINFSRVSIVSTDQNKSPFEVSTSYGSIKVDLIGSGGGGENPDGGQPENPENIDLPTAISRHFNKPSDTNNQSQEQGCGKLITPTLDNVKYLDKTQIDTEKGQAKGVEFSGMADPKVEIAIKIDEKDVGKVNSDGQGVWTFFYNEWINDGVHFISLTSSRCGINSTEFIGPFHTGSKNKGDVGAGKPKNKKTAFQTLAELPLYAQIIIISAICLVIILLVIIILQRRKIKNKTSSD